MWCHTAVHSWLQHLCVCGVVWRSVCDVVCGTCLKCGFVWWLVWCGAVWCAVCWLVCFVVCVSGVVWCGVLCGGCVVVVATMWCVCVMVCTALPPHMPRCNVVLVQDCTHTSCVMGVVAPPAPRCLLCCDGRCSREICAVRVLSSAPSVAVRSLIACQTKLVSCAAGWAVIDRFPTDRPKPIGHQLWTDALRSGTAGNVFYVCLFSGP